jgi:hypothetical protein
MMAGFPVFEPAIFAILRHAFQAQPNLHVTLIQGLLFLGDKSLNCTA